MLKIRSAHRVITQVKKQVSVEYWSKSLVYLLIAFLPPFQAYRTNATYKWQFIAGTLPIIRPDSRRPNRLASFVRSGDSLGIMVSLRFIL